MIARAHSSLLVISLIACSGAARASTLGIDLLAVPQGPGASPVPSAPLEPMPAFGGTPEPASMLLLAGGAIGYGVVRHRRKNAKRKANPS